MSRGVGSAPPAGGPHVGPTPPGPPAAGPSTKGLNPDCHTPSANSSTLPLEPSYFPLIVILQSLGYSINAIGHFYPQMPVLGPILFLSSKRPVTDINHVKQLFMHMEIYVQCIPCKHQSWLSKNKNQCVYYTKHIILKLSVIFL